LTVRSYPPDASVLPSGAKARAGTASVCPESVNFVAFELASRSRITGSSPDVARIAPSGD
jgi:hypothetical protein